MAASSSGKRCPVAVERDLNAAVPEAGLDGLRMGALSDGQRHRRVEEIVEPETVQAGLELGRLPVGCVEARRGDGLARPVREDEPGRAEERSVSELLASMSARNPGIVTRRRPARVLGAARGTGPSPRRAARGR